MCGALEHKFCVFVGDEEATHFRWILKVNIVAFSHDERRLSNPDGSNSQHVLR